MYKEQTLMKSVMKSFSLAILVMASVVLAGCRVTSGNAGPSSGSGSGSGSGPYTIGGVVTGLASGSTGLVLQDNAADNLTITGNGTFTFATAIAAGKTYNVSVFTTPSSPTQTCTVASGSGTVVANVNTVQITCSTGTVSIGGNVVGLLGIGLVLQDNAGDNLAVPTSGPFTFKTAVLIGNAYNVTVLTQPASPTQTCTVTYGSGTASANVGNIQVTCSTGTLSLGGAVSGLAKSGSGIVLQNNGGDNLVVGTNGTFTFPTLLSSGSAYKVTILAQPSGPNQTCTVSNGTGTILANVTNIQIVCPAIFHTIGGTVVGLVGTNSGMVLQNNLGDNLSISSNGTFTFNTPIADGSTYDVSVLVGPNTQPGVGVVLWLYQGTATSDVTSVIVDAGHNDWSWFDGDNTADSKGASKMSCPSGTPPTFDPDTPGGRKYPATWTDSSGNLWLFGGYGLTYSQGFTPPAVELNDMWEYTGTQNYFGSYSNCWNNVIAADPLADPAPRSGSVAWTQPGVGGDLFLFGGEDHFSNFYNDIWRFSTSSKTWALVRGAANQTGVYGTEGVAAAGNTPGSRWGATGRLDSSGNLWLFGGFGYDSTGTLGLLNDLWTYNTTTNLWTWVAGSETVNPTGHYGTLGTPNGALNFPGGRQASMSWLDASGNFWVFGGFDLDSTGSPAALNDLWEYNVTTKVWTWMSGANVVNQTATYGTLGVAAATNVPGARWSSAAWTDHNGDFWLFGGEGYDATGNGSLSDLWEYKGGQWIWVKGPSAVSQGGIYGLAPGPIIYPYVGNGPGSRFAPGYWIDTVRNQFWMFGGEGFDSAGTNGNGLLDDLWRYVPYP
jgi:Kelch motif/Galactose oxidase, central domain